MKQFISIISLIIILTSSIYGQSHVSLKQSQNKSISISQIDRYINTIMETNHISGLAANIVVGDELVWKSSYGLANRASNLTVSDDTPFLWYSMTKSITGVALLKLLDSKDISLDSPINDYLPFEVKHPNYPNTAIHFRMLMAHVSGIRDNWSVLDQLFTYGEDSPIQLGQFLEDYLSHGKQYYNSGLNFGKEPGKAFLYSNVGTALAGYLIECISGQRYEDYCKEKVLIPLGMLNSHFKLSEINQSELAVHYNNAGVAYQGVGHISLPLNPAGFLHSSSNEIANWLIFLLNDGKFNGQEILAKDLLEQMSTQSYPDINPATGLFMGYDPLYQTWGHTGGLPATKIKTCYFVNKEENWGISVLTNGFGDPYPIFYFLMQAAKEYEKMSIQHLDIGDENGNGIAENNELLKIKLGIRNNTLDRSDPMRVELRSDNTGIDFIVNQSDISSTTPDAVIFTNQDFEIKPTDVENCDHINIGADFYKQDQLFSSSTFTIPVGLKHSLIVHDEHHAQKNVANSISRYEEIFTDLDITYTYYDMTLRGMPNLEMLMQYETVYWMTGLDNSNHTLLPDEEQELLGSFLDNHGKLFLTGQNINDQIGHTSFFTDYLHASSAENTWSGIDRVVGVSSEPLGEGISFFLSGGESNNTQYSPGAILPDDEAVSFLQYFHSNKSCGIKFKGDYKLIYLSFGIEGVNNYEMAKTIIERAEIFFSNTSSSEIIDHQAQVSFYPTPFNDALFISVPEHDNKLIQVSMLNLDGRVVFRSKIQASGSNSDFDISSQENFSDLDSGTYLIQILIGKKQFVKKVIKL
ncbi:MAG: serine hydrolase [Bacteroidetes bacterium]|nr:serine hydrolase [Bacteroidota bacterium]